MALSSPLYRIWSPCSDLILEIILNILRELDLTLPNRYDMIWTCTLRVSRGWMTNVANAPETPPIRKGTPPFKIFYKDSIGGKFKYDKYIHDKYYWLAIR